MDGYDLDEAAERSGLSVAELSRFVDLGVIRPHADQRFTPGDLRRAAMVNSLVVSGVPLDALAGAIRDGALSFDFLDAPAFERFSSHSLRTFAELAEESGVPLELLMFVREASGSVPPSPDDRMREEELPYVAWISGALEGGFRPAVVRQMIRAESDGLRRIAETEAITWQSEIIEPATRRGMRADEALGFEYGDRMANLTEQAVIAMYHLQQARAWSAGIIEGVEHLLAAAGIHNRLEHPPAMCFLDITGYTRLTQERGDAAAAELAEELGRVVRQASVHHGGRPVKWLGDGVMVHFPNPASGVVSALEMVEAIVGAGLPPAHVGLHAGPVIFQEGDYYGQTVNLASRIADYAQAGEVIVSQSVVDAAGGAPIAFRGVGPVELKGVAGAMELYAAVRSG
ncbi:MAG TPA: adenylate/guanylate cyclase domain-containing protein [Candidatus Limnocylindrales bacterium]|nr:adenylate/guanylate cyclase domain-containing protein [Candidatus Limnocylindrales bacterium]